MTTIKSFVTEEFEAGRVERDSTAYVAANRKAIAVSSAFIPIIRMAILVGFVATFLLGGWMTIDGTLNVGAYGVLVFLTQRLLWPLTDLATTVDLYERAMASSRRILDLIATPVAIRDRVGAKDVGRLKGAIEFEDVSFAYSSAGAVLHHVNLSIPPGDTVAFVGQTGSGKSTLVKLLLRFYMPSSGRILLDGQPIDTLSLESLRRQIGFVSQDVFLFEGTIGDNIAYGTPAGKPSRQPQMQRKPRNSSSACRTGSTRSSANAGRSSRAGSANGCRSRARS